MSDDDDDDDNNNNNNRRRDSAVGMATGYGLNDRGFGVRVPVWSRIFSTWSRPALGLTLPPIQWVPGELFAWK
jgi:hypothetical protein